MSEPLPGMSYCAEHQGNQAHYASKNCTVCQLERENAELKKMLNIERVALDACQAALKKAKP